MDKTLEKSADNQLSKDEWRISGILSGVYALRMLGLFLVLPVLSLYAAELAGSQKSLWIGWAMGAYGLTQACLQLPFGMVSDKWGRKKTIYIGMTMFIVGTILTDAPLKSIVSRDTVKFGLLRLALLPAAALGVGLLLHLEPTALGVSVLMTGMPAGATAAIFAAKYGSDAPFAARNVVFTTLLSMLTLPLWAYAVG